MKKAEGYVIRKLEEEYVLIPCGERAEEMNETIPLRKQAKFMALVHTLLDVGLKRMLSP